VIARGAAPSTRIVSFTVTEAGYYLDDKDKLDLSFADLAADIERARAAKRDDVTIYGAVCAISARAQGRERRRGHAAQLRQPAPQRRALPRGCWSSSNARAMPTCWPG
jgi:hypothetical protein